MTFRFDALSNFINISKDDISFPSLRLPWRITYLVFCTDLCDEDL